MATDNPVVGSVVSLWRYPVKSMQGEELNASQVTERGLLGARAFALVDAGEGRVASAKNPRRWPFHKMVPACFARTGERRQRSIRGAPTNCTSREPLARLVSLVEAA